MLRGTVTLLNRSIRGDALRSSPHFVRLTGVVVLLLFLVAAHLRSSGLSTPGVEFFRNIAYLGVLLITLAGVGHFSNAITEEKEEGTLGLLLLANLSPLAILLGKSTNRLLSTLLILLAQFPFALLAITLGGISVGQIVATYLALGAYLFLIANLGLLSSVLARRSGEAAALTVLFVLVLLGLAPALKQTCSELIVRGYLTADAGFSRFAEWLMTLHLQISVLAQIEQIFDSLGNWSLLSWQCWGSLLGGGICFLASWLIFRRLLWTPDHSEPRIIRGPVVRRAWRVLQLRPWRWSLAWKDFHFIGGGASLLLLKLIFFPLLILWCLSYTQEIRRFTEATGEQFARDALVLILVIETLLYASQFYHQERRLGVLSTLVMLPYSVGQIGYQKLLGCLCALLPTLLALIVAELIVKASRSHEELLLTQQGLFGFCLLLVLCQVTVLCSLIAKWGALPLALGIMAVIGAFIVPFVVGTMNMIANAEQGALAEVSPLLYATGILSAGLQLEIGRRVNQIAGA